MGGGGTRKRDERLRRVQKPHMAFESGEMPMGPGVCSCVCACVCVRACVRVSKC